MQYIYLLLSFIAGFFVACFIISILRASKECDIEMLLFYLEEMKRKLEDEEKRNEYISLANEQLQEEINKLQHV